MDSQVWVYFSKTATGYEMSGTDIISGIDAFVLMDGVYLIEHSYSEMKESMHFFIYEWDKSQKKRRTIFEGYQRELILVNFAKNVNVSHNIRQSIFKEYLLTEEELNANS